MDGQMQYAVYPQRKDFTLNDVQTCTSREAALELARQRALAGEDVLVDASSDNFVTARTIARIQAVPTEDLL